MGSGRCWLERDSPARWTPPPRGKEGTHPGRVSLVWNVETPLRSGQRPGRLTVRKAYILSGTGWLDKPMPAAERQQETAAS